MSSPNEKKMRCSQPGKKAFCPFTCSPCLSTARRSVAALFLFHLPITCVLLLVGVGGGAGVTARRCPTTEWAQPLGRNQPLATAEQRCRSSIADN